VSKAPVRPKRPANGRSGIQIRPQIGIHLLQNLQALHARFAIERARRFTVQPNIGPFGKGARDGEALPFTAQQLSGAVIEAMRQGDPRQRKHLLPAGVIDLRRSLSAKTGAPLWSIDRFEAVKAFDPGI
jgi:hypothetical protein